MARTRVAHSQSGVLGRAGNTVQRVVDTAWAPRLQHVGWVPLECLPSGLSPLGAGFGWVVRGCVGRTGGERPPSPFSRHLQEAGELERAEDENAGFAKPEREGDDESVVSDIWKNPFAWDFGCRRALALSLSSGEEASKK